MYNEDSEPYGNNLIVSTDLKDTKKTEGGLTLASDIKARNAFKKSIGTVLKVGPDCFEGKEDSKPEVGDLVWFPEHIGFPIKDDKDVTVRVIQDVDVYMFNPNKRK